MAIQPEHGNGVSTIFLARWLENRTDTNFPHNYGILLFDEILDLSSSTHVRFRDLIFQAIGIS
jgi:hypothetical protein